MRADRDEAFIFKILHDVSRVFLTVRMEESDKYLPIHKEKLKAISYILILNFTSIPVES